MTLYEIQYFIDCEGVSYLSFHANSMREALDMFWQQLGNREVWHLIVTIIGEPNEEVN